MMTMVAAAVKRGGSETMATGSQTQRCQMKMMGMILLLSPTTSSLLSSNHFNTISSSSSSSRSSSSSSSSSGDKQKHDGASSFRDIEDALASFNHMLHTKPLPCIIQFNKLLSAIVKMGQYYDAVISLSRQMELAGLSPDIYTLPILINCFSHLQRVDLAFSVFSKIIDKMGVK
ncbi:hypothetical protein OIU79_011509, partial [Salix purpurea]